MGSALPMASIASTDEINPGIKPKPLELFHQALPRTVLRRPQRSAPPVCSNVRGRGGDRTDAH